MSERFCYVCWKMCIAVVGSFRSEFLLNVCVGGGAHYPGEFGVLEHPP